MESILEKSLDKSRSLLYGLLINCMFSEEENRCCPIAQMRDNLSLQEKYNFVMGLSKESINSVLDMHEKCYNQECCPRCEANR